MRNKILQILRESRDNYISGEEMADKLGVSRTAVWKHIKEMRAQGYDIESHARKGYVLKEAPDALLSGEIVHDLQTSIIGQNIICHEEIDSTNNEAKRLAREGAAEGTVVVAECQTGGKGRLERRFFSPK
ncbi:MAG: HTH domain-containing protein, partial [Selenomonas sp.]|nr:HTH domain-containing protein [Selenomonas sp.]